MKLTFAIVLVLLFVNGCSDRDLESAVYQQRHGRMQCYCVRPELNYHLIDITSISSSSTSIKNVWKVTIKGRCEKTGEVTQEAEYFYKDGKVRFVKGDVEDSQSPFCASSSSWITPSFKMNTDQVAVDRKRDTDERTLADARAKLQAAGGATNEAALADFKKSVKPIRDKAFRRKYAEWSNGASYDFDRRFLSRYPEAPEAGQVKARLENAERRFEELSTDEWILKGP